MIIGGRDMREHVEEAINQNGQSGRREVSWVKPRSERALPCATDIRRATLKSLGFSFDRAWMNALFLMPVALAQSSEALSDLLPRIYLVELSTCTLALALAALLLAIGKTTRHITSLISRHFLGGSLACAGVLLLIPSLIFTGSPSFAFVIIGLLTGLGEALLILQWCDSFRGAKNLVHCRTRSCIPLRRRSLNPHISHRLLADTTRSHCRSTRRVLFRAQENRRILRRKRETRRDAPRELAQL